MWRCGLLWLMVLSSPSLDRATSARGGATACSSVPDPGGRAYCGSILAPFRGADQALRGACPGCALSGRRSPGALRARLGPRVPGGRCALALGALRGGHPPRARLCSPSSQSSSATFYASAYAAASNARGAQGSISGAHRRPRPTRPRSTLFGGAPSRAPRSRADSASARRPSAGSSRTRGRRSGTGALARLPGRSRW